jgi:hypothetical protein
MILIGEKMQYGALWEDDTDRGKGAVWGIVG